MTHTNRRASRTPAAGIPDTEQLGHSSSILALQRLEPPRSPSSSGATTLEGWCTGLGAVARNDCVRSRRCSGWRNPTTTGGTIVTINTLGPTNITSSDPEDLRMFMRSARREAAADGEASFRAGMGNPDVVAEFGLHDGCLFPQIGHLHTLLTRLPRACFVLTHRPVERWLASVRAHNSMLPQLLASCPLEPRNESGLARWYTSFIALAAAALATRPCAAVLNIEDPATGHQLAEVFNGTNASCWGKHHTSAAREATLTSRACVRPQECEPHTWSVPRHHVKPHGHAHRSAGRLALQNLRVH